MRIAIIGGGITGLTAAYELSHAGHAVTVFEKEPYLGGLAYGFKESGWDWHIEAAYHHLFTNDRHILSLIRSLGLSESIIIKRPITATLWREKMYQLDSPFHLLTFPGLSIVDKFRTAAAIAFLKFNPFWKPLEAITAEQFLISIGGKNAWKTIWEPLLYGKFGTFAPCVAASWFWARIVKRTSSLCYIQGGFHTLIEAIGQAIVQNGGTILTLTSVTSIKKIGAVTFSVSWNNKKKTFDRVLLTTPTPIAFRLFPNLLPRNPRYVSLSSIPHLFAQTLIVETDKPMLDKVYWLNVTDERYPFLAAVAHTNFMDPKHYGNRHLTYFGNYLSSGHPNLTMTKEQLLKKFLPYMKRLSHGNTYSIRNTYMFVGPFAQPVHERHYSQKIPPIPTPIPGLFMANMDYIVPWDRGTNYAVELGQKAATLILRAAK